MYPLVLKKGGFLLEIFTARQALEKPEFRILAGVHLTVIGLHLTFQSAAQQVWHT